MKKILISLLVVSILMSLCACSPSGLLDAAQQQQEQENETPTASQTENAATEDRPTTLQTESITTEDMPETSQSKFEDVSDRTKIATTVEEFDSVIGKFVNLDHYSKQTPYSNADQISTYKMKSDVSKTIAYDLDYTITAEGITFSLPITCGELEAAGWDCRNNLASEVESSDRMGVTVSFRNYAGKEFFASVVNRSGVTKQLKDCYVVGVGFDKYKHNYLENITTLSDTAPFVTVCGDLDSNSSLQDVLNRLGEPWMIEFYTDGDVNNEPLAFIRLTYQVKSDTEYGCLKIAIAAETDDVMIIDYDHELAS